MTDATKKSPAVGDVVRIGDLPVGAVVDLCDSGNRITLATKSGGTWAVAYESGRVGGASVDCPGRIVSLPDAPAATVPESDAVRHWHAKATEALAECERLRAENARLVAEGNAAWVQPGVPRAGELERLQAEAERLTAERDEARSLVKMLDECRRLAGARDAEATDSSVRRCAADRDAALAQVAALQESAAENGRLRAEINDWQRQANVENGRLNNALAIHSGAMADIAEMCRVMGEADATSPVSKAQAWADEREELRSARTGLAEEWHAQCVAARREVASLTAHLTRTQAEHRQALDGREAERARADDEKLRADNEARLAPIHIEAWRRANEERNELFAAITAAWAALGYTHDHESESPVPLAEAIERHCTRLAEECLAARDAQEGARIAAWVEATGWVACARCWWPAMERVTLHGVDVSAMATTICRGCAADDARARAAGEVPATCSECRHVSDARDYRGLAYCTHPERMGMDAREHSAPPDKCPLRGAR